MSNSFFFRYFKKIYYESEINKKNVWTNCHPFVISFAGLLLHDQPCSVSWTLHMYFVPKDLRQIPWTWNWKLLFNLFQLFIFIKPLEIESMCRCFNWLLSELNKLTVTNLRHKKTTFKRQCIFPGKIIPSELKTSNLSMS